MTPDIISTNDGVVIRDARDSDENKWTVLFADYEVDGKENNNLVVDRWVPDYATENKIVEVVEDEITSRRKFGQEARNFMLRSFTTEQLQNMGEIPGLHIINIDID